MRIEMLELANFRKLKSVRVGIANETTVFVGTNNSGKTSAMLALRYFLIDRERARLSLNDFNRARLHTHRTLGCMREPAISAY